MAQATAHQTESKAPGAPLSGLDEALREGARRMLQQAVEAEIAEYIEAHSGALDDQGHRLVVRNGHTPERTIQTGLGDIPVRRPRVDDRRVDAEGPGQGPGAATGFYDFPAEHWLHLRTTNPIESTFATVRLRTTRTKGAGSRLACMTMVFKLAQAAERKWRKINGHALLGGVIQGVQFKDGYKAAA
jgi:transposase-like protein